MYTVFIIVIAFLNNILPLELEIVHVFITMVLKTKFHINFYSFPCAVFLQSIKKWSCNISQIACNH